jgi:subtilisin family serine protease
LNTRDQRIRSAVGAALVLATAAALPACSGGSTSDGTAARLTAVPSSPSSPSSGATGAAAITLITGDRVRVLSLPDGSDRFVVAPGPGRSHITFAQSTHTDRGKREVTLLPADAAPLLAAGRLDPRLFNVTELLRQGFGDEREATLPLIITYAGGAPMHALVASRTTRALPSIGGQATVVDKNSAGAFWSTLTTGKGPRGVAPMETAGVSKVWLDGRAQPVLDQSAPQIGAPVAWGLGLTGKGVTVALLDTGIKLDHPDFAGRIAETKDFTATRPDASDDVGHGTHCAGILAGSGAASHGKYKGIAPDATLIEGKVCMLAGCPESAIIAGMEWAAPAARIVSMSLGSVLPSDGTDPMSQSVNALTTKYGTLFVVAAGNGGAGQTVGAPGAADLALTVGSVTKQDTMSDFSSRGPRIGDYVVKPEIAAPGSDIVSARAKGTRLGDLHPVDDFYTRMSGTSMATPHVAGAAALLAQLHPDWKAAELKAALVSSSKRLDGAGVGDDGAGRVDVARAVTQRIFATVGTVSFGIYSWPHTEPPVTRTVSYRNDGDVAVTLTLAAAVTAPDGKAAPSGLFTVAPPSLTVPAQGTADARVTFTPSLVATAGGVFGGVISASDGSNGVDVAVDAYEEPESYDLTIHRIARGDGPSTAYGQVTNPATGQFRTVLFSSNDEVVMRLPRGRYDVSGLELGGLRPDGTIADSTIASEPGFELTATSTVTWDFRRGQPLSAIVDRKSAVTVEHGLVLTITTPAGISSLETFAGDPMFPGLMAKLCAVPTSRVVKDYGYVLGYRAVLTEPASGTAPASSEPYLYDVIFFDEGRIPTRLAHRVHDWQLASVLSTYHAEGAPSAGQGWDLADDPRGEILLTGFNPIAFPSRRLELYTADGSVRWQHLRQPTTVNYDGTVSTVRDDLYRPGLQLADWDRAPLGPAFGDQGALRDGKHIVVEVSPFSSGDGNHLTASLGLMGETTLSRDGKLIPPTKSRPERAVFEVPPDDGVYTLTTTLSRPSSRSPIGTQLSGSWTFHSQAPTTGVVPLPLMVVRATGLVDIHDVAPSGELYPLGLVVERPLGAPASPVSELELDVSYDDGQSWQTAPTLRVGDRALALLQHPSADGFVSLRMKVRDEAGNTALHTTIRAYAIASLATP